MKGLCTLLVAGMVLYGCGNGDVEKVRQGYNDPETLKFRQESRQKSQIAREKQKEETDKKIIEDMIISREFATRYNQELGYITLKVFNEIPPGNSAENERAKSDALLKDGRGGYYLAGKNIDGEVYCVEVLDSPDMKKEVLAVGVTKGAVVTFPAGNLKSANENSFPEYYTDETIFSPGTTVGKKRADRIKIIDSPEDKLSTFTLRLEKIR